MKHMFDCEFVPFVYIFANQYTPVGSMDISQFSLIQNVHCDMPQSSQYFAKRLAVEVRLPNAYISSHEP